ncbi:hypothetical protein PB01_09640 [Psychrobacillus glaciei]|uniref:Chromosome segregation ATPase n=1 Tax=Psychrobacillus glaciei TaxID=2283160 RepID=A0A5J6SME5_9BACI|nr:hypothetical protein [Psychrobacillus glaciei]QFF99068.1 hypothetical protein PB01_09640 [Psychrobacillus glaciei]
MPAISKIRFTNVVYEDGQKRYNDDLFRFEGFNGAVVLENGGGKTVFIQTLLQAVIPHTELGERKIRDTLKLEGPAHIAIEWIISEKPRRYVMTAVSLFLIDNKVDSFRYVYEYGANDSDGIEYIPFVSNEGKRAAEKYEIQEYYARKTQHSPLAKAFGTIKSYRHFLEEQYHIISDEWDSIVKINKNEGGIEAFFDECKIEKHLYDRLIIPTIEASITGFDSGTFADTFEEQQKSFKLYKELRAQIAEYQSIEEELTAFVRVNEILYTNTQEYKERKADAKGISVLAYKQKEQVERELELLQQSMNNLEFVQAQHGIKMDSYTIGLKEEELATVNRHLNELLTESDRIRSALYQLEKNYYSLQLSKQHSIIKKQIELTTYYKEEMDRLDEDSDAVDFAAELSAIHQQMKGHFIEQQEKLEKEHQGLKYESNPIEEALLTCEKEEEALNSNRKILEKEQIERTTHMEFLEQSMRKIRHSILSNVDQELISTRLPEWILKHAQLDESIVSTQNEVKKSRETLLDLRIKKEELQEKNKKDSINQANLELKLSQMKEAHLAQKEKLANLSFIFSRKDSLYMTQSSTEQELLRTIGRLKDEKEDKLTLERLAFRFIDDYGSQDVFFADPYLEKQLINWSNSIGLIDTGIRYLNRLGLPMKEQLSKFPSWPVTLITTEDKKQALIDRVTNIQRHLLHPIHVIDLQEAKLMTERGTEESSQVILPLHWQGNMQESSFAEWKDSLRTEAKKVKEERQEVEELLRIWESAFGSLKQFFEDYPYERVKEIEDLERTIKEQIRESERVYTRLQSEISELENRLVVTERQISDKKEELAGLAYKITEGRKHENEAKEVLRLRESLESIRLELINLVDAARQLQNRKASFGEEKEILREKMASNRTNLDWLTRDEFYQLVQNETPVFSENSLALLKSKAENVRFALHKISSSRGEWETKMNNATERKKDAEQVISSIQDDWSDFDEHLHFPSNGDLQMEKLRNRIRNEKSLLKNAVDKYTEQDKKVTVVYAKWNELKNYFHLTHPNTTIHVFTEALHIVQNILLEEKNKIVDQLDKLQNGMDQFNKELANIHQSIAELDKFNEAHHFHSTFIEEKKLNEQEVNEFTYARMKTVKRVTTAMKAAKGIVEVEQERVSNKRIEFNDYVRSNMSDAKMRDNLFQGLEHKRDYLELVAFHQNIRSKMESIIRFNEESIRWHDEQLEHFVTHMHEHARTVVRELEIIPTKTRIKFASDTKQIFHFRIPEWEEKDGLSRLRAYIDEILGWIEKDRYLDMEGKVNNAKIRTDVEKWFATPQLLRIILQNGEMKVSCRKVTNNNEVTSKSFSWKESNEWSGGEKWSKNMTLFLGLLNYVAEKKKLLNTSMKRNRAVILDNPFGKASSEHVLSPVFFIAEKLGFQIIALTAHAEGKFLRDYFPVIYSCRLREARDSSKKIMTKVKTVNHAFFQDHEPVALERLGESEQLSLLD